MPSEHIVVDGSNIATEGRSAPSLAQLEEAVTELRREFPEAEVTVIVDATFAHRIDPSELERFEEKALNGEYVHPPAGAVGRGDAFLLRVAEKVNAITLSNDSFQEFHGEHPWLFERGRLLGATPVPGVGWIFIQRTPVRGPKSRRATKDTEKERRKISRAIEVATKEAVSPKVKTREQARKRSPEAAAAEEPSPPPRRRANPAGAVVNDPLTFISFIADHPLATEVSGRVESYTSHGAVVFVNGVQCYVPLANMATPAPRSAREVLKRDEERTFVVTALDPQRRGVELAVPGVGEVSGRPSEEMIAAEVRLAKKKATAPRQKAAKASPAPRAARKKPDEPGTAATRTSDGVPEPAKKTAKARRRPVKATEATPAEASTAAPSAMAAAPRVAKKTASAAAKKAAPARKRRESAASGEPAADAPTRRRAKKTAPATDEAPAPPRRPSPRTRKATTAGAPPGAPPSEAEAPATPPRKRATSKKAARKKTSS